MKRVYRVCAAGCSKRTQRAALTDSNCPASTSRQISAQRIANTVWPLWLYSMYITRGIELKPLNLSEGEQRLASVVLVLALALLPHATHLPIWIPLMVIGAAAWRFALEHRGKALPWRWLRSL